MAEIKKVKLKNGEVEIHTVETAGKDEKEAVFKSTDRPHPDLETAFESLITCVYEILEWPGEYAVGRIKVAGVSFSESEDGVRGAVMTGYVKLETAAAPFCFNTPHLAFSQYSPNGSNPIMSEDAQRKLKRLEDEARAFITGKRAQLSLSGT